MLGVTGLILSGCFFTDEIKLEDIQNFKITVNIKKITYGSKHEMIWQD